MAKIHCAVLSRLANEEACIRHAEQECPKNPLRAKLAEVEKILKASRRAASIGISESETREPKIELGAGVCRWCDMGGGEHLPGCPVIRFADIVMMQVDFEHHGREYLEAARRG